MSGLINTKINPYQGCYKPFPEPRKQRTFLPHQYAPHTEARPAQEDLLLVSNKVLSSSGCSKEWQGKKKREVDSRRLQKEKRMPAAKWLTACAAAGRSITVFQVCENSIAMLFGEKNQASSVTWIQLTFFSLSILHISNTLQFFPLDISAISQSACLL